MSAAIADRYARPGPSDGYADYHHRPRHHALQPIQENGQQQPGAMAPGLRQKVAMLEKAKEAARQDVRKESRPAQSTSGKKVAPSPPAKIVDEFSKDKPSYSRLRFLGEGGFARVYEVISADGQRFAAKVVHKDALDTEKKRVKLYAEIKIHKMMAHPHIAQFVECFEDGTNVYILLELCENGNMMDMLRRRKSLTEAEARFYLVQIIGACQYMHKSRVMHRDLKLGNIFLDRKMGVKVGDFGLAALMMKDGERRRTVCGTPNYIAPEVLYGSKAEGHSYEVDVWSCGVILYTMLVGKPPFQTKDVKAIYQNIKELNYAFPEKSDVSASARDLVRRILNPDPKKRPSFKEILSDGWFTEGTFPDRIPAAASDSIPNFSHISSEQSLLNFAKAKRDCALGQNLPLALPVPISQSTMSAHARQAMAPAIAQQEKEFKAAVKPESPIAALLSSAKKPPVVAPSLPSMPRGEPSLLRKFQSQSQNAKSPLRRERARARAPARDLADLCEEDAIEDSMEAAQQPVAQLRRTTVPKENAHRDPDAAQSPTPPRVFISSWLDYAHKYGMGFALTNGSVGVHFNDASAMVYSPDKQTIDHIIPNDESVNQPSHHRSGFHVDSVPSDEFTQERVYLLVHFDQYISTRLHHGHDWDFKDDNLNHGMIFLAKYWRLKHLIGFRLSNDVLQFNFNDHTKLIVSQDGMVISYIDADYKMWTWSLAQLVDPESKIEGREKRRMAHAWKKLEYTRDVIARLDKYPKSGPN